LECSLTPNPLANDPQICLSLKFKFQPCIMPMSVLSVKDVLLLLRLLMIHRLGSSHDFSFPMFPWLKDFGYTMPDMCVAGRIFIFGGEISIDDIVYHAHALLDKLHMHKVVIVGHSMGGNMAPRFAAKYPDRSAALDGCKTILERAVKFIEELPVIRRCGFIALQRRQRAVRSFSPRVLQFDGMIWPARCTTQPCPLPLLAGPYPHQA
jgi:pimeloyl-ACP methyl ester carboxylesterase